MLPRVQAVRSADVTYHESQECEFSVLEADNRHPQLIIRHYDVRSTSSVGARDTAMSRHGTPLSSHTSAAGRTEPSRAPAWRTRRWSSERGKPQSAPATSKIRKKAYARPKPGNRDTENGSREACACPPRIPCAPVFLFSACARVRVAWLPTCVGACVCACACAACMLLRVSCVPPVLLVARADSAADCLNPAFF